MFEIGEKVVCIDDSVPRGDLAEWYSERLFYRRVYVVRKCVPGGRQPGVCLVGIHGFVYDDGTELKFEATRFRRLTDVQAENRQMRADGLANVRFSPRPSSWPRSRLVPAAEVMEKIGVTSRREFLKIATMRRLLEAAPGFYAKIDVDRCFPGGETFGRAASSARRKGRTQ